MSSPNEWGLPTRAMAQTGASAPSSILLLENGEIAGFGYWESGLFGANYTAASGLQAWVPMPMTLLKNTDGTPFISNVIAVDAGENFFAFLKSDGTAWFIGGSITDVMEPLKQINVTNVVSISASQSFLVLLTSDGKVYVRGQHRDVICYNSESGTNQDWDASLNLVSVGTSSSAKKIPYRAPKVVKIAAGGNHFAMLDSNGYAWAAGNNDWGQLCSQGNRYPKGPQLLDIHRNVTNYSGEHDYKLSDIWAGDRITVFAIKTAIYNSPTQYQRLNYSAIYTVGCRVPFKRPSPTTVGDSWIKTPHTYAYINGGEPLRIWQSYSDRPVFKVTIGGGIEGLSEDYRRMIFEEISSAPRLFCVGFEGFERDLPVANWQRLVNGDWTLKIHDLTSAKLGVIDTWSRYIGPFDIYYLDKLSGSVFTMASPEVMKTWSGLEAVDFTSYNVEWSTRLRPLVFRNRKTISSSAPLAGPYGFDVYDTKRRSILPKIAVVDVFLLAPGDSVAKVYQDAALVRAIQSGTVTITLFESPTLGPTMASKPVQAIKGFFIASKEVLTPLSPASLDLLRRIDKNKALRQSLKAENIEANFEVSLLNKKYNCYPSQEWPGVVPGYFRINENGYFESHFNGFYYITEASTAHDRNGWVNAFYATGGPHSRIYGRASVINAAADETVALQAELASHPIEAQIGSGVFVPSLVVTAYGGNMQSRLIVLCNGV